MRILVTGGLGFIGSNFIRYVLARNEEIQVINIDSMSYGANPSNLVDLESFKRYRFVKGDAADRGTLEPFFNDLDAVVNFAAETHVDRSIVVPSPFLYSNVYGTFALLEMARKHDIRGFVQVSTDEVYGAANDASYTEEDRLNPSNPYAASKAAADMFVLSYWKTYGLRSIISRSTNNFGPYQFPEKLIPKVIIRAIRNLPVPLYGTGKNIRDWLYVIDHCEALDLILNKGREGEIYNVSAGNEFSNLEVASSILAFIGKSPKLIALVQDRPGHDFRYSLNSSKIRREMGWSPRHAFDQALAKTVEWYLKNESWWSPLATDDVLDPTPWTKTFN